MNNATVNRIIKMYKEGKEAKDIDESLAGNWDPENTGDPNTFPCISENVVFIVIEAPR